MVSGGSNRDELKSGEERLTDNLQGKLSMARGVHILCL